MPDKVVPVRELEGIDLDQVAIGSCTNSSINDLGIASEILKNRTVHFKVSLGVSPGSKQVVGSSIGAGIFQTLVSSGARILESACGPCIGMGFAPRSGGVSLRTFNRNFKGRSGTPDAQVYLVSPETAAASAVTGKITDPRTIKGIEKKDYSRFIQIDDSMIIKPLPIEEASKTEIIRGPNIKPCPAGRSLEDDLELKVLIKTGDNITTDQIMPAGAKVLPFRSNIPEMSKYVFESIDPAFPERALKAKNGLIAAINYTSSSREHAALHQCTLSESSAVKSRRSTRHPDKLRNPSPTFPIR